jgi:hypothetical protein
VEIGALLFALWLRFIGLKRSKRGEIDHRRNRIHCGPYEWVGLKFKAHFIFHAAFQSGNEGLVRLVDRELGKLGTEHAPLALCF